MKQQVFNYEALESFLKAKEDVLEACRETPPSKELQSIHETSIEIAAAAKQAIRSTDLSREQLVDGINEAFGLQGKAKLSIHMFNHYLSKPSQYPMPAWVLLGIIVLTGSLEPAQALVAPVGARVISAEEQRLMHLGRIEDMHSELLAMKRQLKGSK
jgi:hypothetical protein